MTPALRDEWVAALRSGTYTQGKGCLRKGNEYCCLGVLADIIGLEWVLRGDEHYDAMDFGSEGMGWEDVIPQRAADSIDLRQNTQKHLASMNDEEGRSFDEIADWIEEHL